MFYQEALSKFIVLITCLQAEIDTGESSCHIRKPESANSLPFAHFHVDAYFCVVAYRRDVVVVIKMGAYIYGVLILCGCLLSRFYSNHLVNSISHRCLSFVIHDI